MTTFNTGKSTPKNLSAQVKNILAEKGFSNLFNERDFNYFSRTIKAFNKALAIAEKIIEENTGENESDFAEYVF